MENKYNAENKDRERLARILKEKNAEEENLRNKINYYEKEVLKR